MVDALDFHPRAHLRAWEGAEPRDASLLLMVAEGNPGEDCLRRPGINLGGVVRVMNDIRFTSRGDVALIFGRDEGV